jgi:hypothetical protein
MPSPLRGVSGRLYVDLAGGASELAVSCFSPAATLLSQRRLPGPFGTGWNSARLLQESLPNGVSYLRIQALRGSEASEARILRIYKLE